MKKNFPFSISEYSWPITSQAWHHKTSLPACLAYLSENNEKSNDPVPIYIKNAAKYEWNTKNIKNIEYQITVKNNGNFLQKLNMHDT